MKEQRDLSFGLAAGAGVVISLVLMNLILDEVLKNEINKIEDKKIGKKLNNDYIYTKEDFLDIYYVETIDQISNESTTYFVKKYEANQKYEYNEQQQKFIWFGEKYLQEFNESIQQKSMGGVTLYLSAIDDELVSVQYTDKDSKEITLINTITKEIPLYNCLYEYNIDKEVITSDDLLDLKEVIDQKLMENSTEKVFVK